MKIKRMQAGGIVYTPFIPNYGVQTASAQQSSNDPEKITGTITKEIVDILKEQGLTNDVDNFLQQANSFLSRSGAMSSPFGGQSDYNMGHLTQVLSMANRVKRNKDLHDLAANHLTDQGAWSEVALDKMGRMYVYTEDGIQTVTPDEYHKNRDQYQAMTNGQLMSLRESQQGMAFNEDILRGMNDAIGMNELTNYIKDTIKSFGTTETKGYTEANRGRIENGFEQLLTGGPEGIYKYTQSSQVNKGDAEDVQYALKYLYSTLGENAKRLLKAKTAAEGMNPNSNDTLQLLAMSLREHTSENFGVDFDSTATTVSTGGSGSYAEKMTDITYPQMLAANIGVPLESFQLFTKDSKNGALSVTGYNWGAPMDTNENKIQQTNLKELTDKAAFGTMADLNNMFFGDQRVDPGMAGENIRKFMWDNSNLQKVMLPVNADGSPALDAIERYEAINDWIEDTQPTVMAINRRVQSEFGQDAKYDPVSGLVVWDPRATKAFWTVDVITSSDAVDFNKKSPWITEIDRSKEIRDLYNHTVNYGSAATQTGKKGLGHAEVDVNARNFYKAPIFIPVLAPTLGTVQYGSTKVPESTLYGDVAERQRLSQQAQQIDAQW